MTTIDTRKRCDLYGTGWWPAMYTREALLAAEDEERRVRARYLAERGMVDTGAGVVPKDSDDERIEQLEKWAREILGRDRSALDDPMDDEAESFGDRMYQLASDDDEKDQEMANTTIKEPNTGRVLYMADAGGGRLALFDGESNFIVEVTKEFLQLQTEKLGSISTSALPDRPEKRHANPNIYHGALYTREQIDGFSREEVQHAAALAGLVTRSVGTTTLRNRLKAHHNSLRSEFVRRALREARARVEGLQAKVSQLEGQIDVLKKRLQEEARTTSARFEKRLQEEARTTAAQRNSFEKLHGEYDTAVAELTQAKKRIESDYAAIVSKDATVELLQQTVDRLILEDDTGTEQDEDMTDDNAKQDAPQTTALATAGTFMAQAAQLAALQRGSSIFTDRATKVLINAGIPATVLRDEKVQRLINAVVPLLLMQFGDKIPGVRNMKNLQPLAQQQMMIDVAKVLDLAVGDMFGILGDVASALNEGDPETVEQLPG